MPEAECYPGQLNQLFLNLFKNAAESLSGAGTVRVACRVLDDGRLQVVIADDGAGIAPEHLPRIFDPGFTTKGVGVGTGLGLSICYRIVRDHGGTIDVDSELGKGTTVSVTLPRVAPG
jgi:two-component system NtrC family sensor kinase